MSNSENSPGNGPDHHPHKSRWKSLFEKLDIPTVTAVLLAFASVMWWTGKIDNSIDTVGKGIERTEGSIRSINDDLNGAGGKPGIKVQIHDASKGIDNIQNTVTTDLQRIEFAINHLTTNITANNRLVTQLDSQLSSSLRTVSRPEYEKAIDDKDAKIRELQDLLVKAQRNEQTARIQAQSLKLRLELANGTTDEALKAYKTSVSNISRLLMHSIDSSQKLLESNKAIPPKEKEVLISSLDGVRAHINSLNTLP